MKGPIAESPIHRTQEILRAVYDFGKKEWALQGRNAPSGRGRGRAMGRRLPGSQCGRCPLRAVCKNHGIERCVPEKT